MPSIACGDGLLTDSADSSLTSVPPVSGDLPGYIPPTPCHGARQTGCESEEKCAIASDAWTCVAPGEKALGAACREDLGQGDDCLAALHCYEGICHELCTYADACSDRFEICIPIPSDADHLGICLASCDPIAQDCTNTSDGERQGCYISVTGPVCAPIAEQPPLVPGLNCGFLNECAVGAGCVEIGGRSQCAAYCDFEENADAWDAHCAVKDSCRRLEGGDTTGVCGA
ncbi:MAG: hypothetical protein GY811_22855 [Myxococcales bacterium]|nr:hypothetical protein [Myxococcales bacterium]